MTLPQFPNKQALLPPSLVGQYVNQYGIYTPAGGPAPKNWLTDAHIWLDMDQTPIENIVDPSWTKTGTAYWGTFGTIPSSWITYKRLYIELKDQNVDYGTEWCINMRLRNEYIQVAYNSAGRPSVYRGNPDTTNDAFFISNQAEGLASTPTELEFRMRTAGVTSSIFFPWGFVASPSAWHNVTLASGGGDTKLFVNGVLRNTYGANIAIPASASTTSNIGGALSASFNVEGVRHFSWLNYKPTDDYILNTIHPAMSLM